MKAKTQKIIKIAQKTCVLVFTFVFLVGLQVLAATSNFTQSIIDGSLSVDIVDSDGNSVGSPAVAFASKTFSFSTQDATGSFAPSAQRIRVSNPTVTSAWTVALAASSPTASWTADSNHYDFNDAGGYVDDGSTTDADSYGGQMTVDPSGGTISGVNGCATTGTSKGSSAPFVEGSTNSITIFSSTSAAAYCRFDYVGAAANITQKIPAAQTSGSYSLNMTVTAT